MLDIIPGDVIGRSFEPHSLGIHMAKSLPIPPTSYQ